MSLLSVAQEIAPLIGLAKPATLVASSEPEHEQLLVIAQRAADVISEAYDWQALTKLHTLTGNGTTTDFSLPADFGKFTDDSDDEGKIYSTLGIGPLVRVHDLSEWLRREVRQIGQVTYSWILYGNLIRIKPALPNAATAQFFYQSENLIVDGVSSVTRKARFSADNDLLLLDERMLKLCMLWMWRHSNEQSYAQYMQEYEQLKSRLITRDKGSKSIRFGRSKLVSNVQTAYPYPVF